MSTTLRATSLVDSPKEHHQPDQLEIRRYEDALVKLIQSADTPLTIALQGEWGSGKTSLMNSLRYRLSTDGCQESCFHSIWVNTWEYSLMREPQEAVVKILTSIISQIGEIHPSQEAAAAKVTRLLGKIGSGFMMGARIGLNVVAKQTTGVDDITGLSQTSTPEEKKGEPSSEIFQAKEEIKAIIKECLVKSGSSKRGFLFFIDDLDRIDPPVAVQVLELLKNIFDIGNCIFILAIDYDVVVKGLKPKFGEYSPATEREFRSFFDKIIQVPFAMPVASYQVDGFLLDSLRRVGFLLDEDAQDPALASALTFFCKSSVGTNPRSLKRLVNILSLLQLLKDDGEIVDAVQKQVDFALVCLQISYPKVYGFLASEPDVGKWDAAFRKRQGLEDLDEAVRTRLENDESLDDEWEQTLFLICQDSPYLRKNVYHISGILNRINCLETKDPISERIKSSLRISSVTHVSSDVVPDQTVSFQQGPFLKELHWMILEQAAPLAEQKGLKDFELSLSRIQTRLGYQAKLGENEIVYIETVSVYPVEDQFRCQIWFRYLMIWQEDNCGDFDVELKKLGRTREQFDELFESLKQVCSGNSGWLRPEVDPVETIRCARSQSCPYFDLGIWYNFYAKSPDDFFQGPFISMLSGMIVDLLLKYGEITAFLRAPLSEPEPDAVMP